MPEKRIDNKKYLGFVVIRPIPGKQIGRTILPNYEPAIYDPNIGFLSNKRYFPTLIEYHSNIFGQGFKTKSIAFQQQDSVISACATVALWSTIQKSTRSFGYYQPTPLEITQSANKHGSSSRPIPSSGLEVRQIIDSIRSLGMELEVVDFYEAENQPYNKCPTPESFSSLCYAYLRGGFPIFLGIEIEDFGRHAVTILGYQLLTQINMWYKYSPEKHFRKRLPLVGTRLKELYLHDDNIGPFARFFIHYKELKNVSKKDGELVLFCEDYKKKSENENGKTILKKIKPMSVIIPLYSKIRINYWDINEYIYSYNLMFQDLKIFDKRTNYEWDFYLTEINDYKEMIIENRANFSKELTIHTSLLFF